MKLYIKYMVSLRCRLIVKEELRKLGLHHEGLELGMVDVTEPVSAQQLDQLRINLLKSGLELLDDKKNILIERIKNVVTEMIHYAEEPIATNYSELLSSKLNYDYTYLSNIFSEVKGITIKQFIILHKIERVKELLMYDEMSLKEISFKLGYSSVAHLSNQFKKITGLTPTYFKSIKKYRTQNLEDI